MNLKETIFQGYSVYFLQDQWRIREWGYQTCYGQQESAL